MNLSLIDNAIDSLKISISAFSIWNHSDGEDRALKVAVLFLHNAVELIIKALLIRENAECIYSAGQEDVIAKAKKQSSDEGVSLDEYLIRCMDIKTESYSTLVRKYLDNKNLSVKVKGYLEKLGKYRNSISHFGINNEDNKTELLDVMHGTFRIILEDFYDELLEIDDYFSYNDVFDFLEPWCEMSENVLKEMAVEELNRNIRDFLMKIEVAICSDKMKKFMAAYTVECEDNSVYENNDIRIVFKQAGRIIEFISKYDAYYNYTILCICAVDYPMVFVVMHDDNKMLLYDNLPSYDEYRLEAIYNKTIEENSHVKCVTENNIRDALINTMRRTILYS